MNLPPKRAPAKEHLDLFGEAIRRHLGLSQPARNPQTLIRRFNAAMDASALSAEPDLFIQRLEEATPGSLLFETLANVVPNRETSFFRDVEQLEAFVTHLSSLPTSDKPLKVLSAGCANGEETYTLAMLLFESNHLAWGRQFVVEGIDVSSAAIAAAKRGWFRATAVGRAGIGPNRWVERYFRKEDGGIQARDLLRTAVRFQQANLVDPESLAHLGGYDAIVCRNVLIYFDSTTLQATVQRLLDLLRPGGTLLLGHAEAGLVEGHDHLRQRAGGGVWFQRSPDD